MKTSPIIKFAALCLVLIAMAALTGCAGTRTYKYKPDPRAVTVRMGDRPLVSKIGSRTLWHESPEAVLDVMLQFAATQEKEMAKLVAHLAELEMAVKTGKKKK